MEYGGLSTVASGIGRPLYPDAITCACTRLDFARVCVMLDISSTLPKHIVIMVPKEDGSESACKVDVEYEWLPPKCTTCGCYEEGAGTEGDGSRGGAGRVQRALGYCTDTAGDRGDKGKAIVLYNPFDALSTFDIGAESSKGPISSPELEGSRIWQAWDNDFVGVDVLDVDVQHVHCRVEIRGIHTSIFMTFVYGVNDVGGRRILWHNLSRISLTVGETPWLVGGDFNTVIDASEICGQSATLEGRQRIYRHGPGRTHFILVLPPELQTTPLLCYEGTPLLVLADLACSGPAEPSLTTSRVQQPTLVAEFRPISCYNVLYKVITKLIVQRMSGLLERTLYWLQSAALPTARCALKVDIRKAYDTVEWDFLRAVLQLFGFPALFISWIEECVTTPSFSVCLNGSPHGFFRGARGLRQGDPMSPYLFVLVMEVLNLILQQIIAQDGGFSYHWRCEAVHLFQLGFADDLLLFSRADESSIHIFKRGLSIFADLSGLHVNPQKSHLILSRSAAAIRETLLSILDYQEGVLPLWYLGLPLLASRLTIADCTPLLLKIDSRIKGWDGIMLSFAGRVQLIKSVLLALQMYWAMAFILPKGITGRLRSVSDHFFGKVLWGLGMPKSLGIRHLWRIISGDRSSVWVEWISHYRLRYHSVWTVSDSTGSWGWKKLVRLRNTPASSLSTGLARGLRSYYGMTRGMRWALLSHGSPLALSTRIPILWRSSVREVQRLVRFHWPYRDWDTAVQWASGRWRSKHVVHALFRALLASLVYHIWQERNCRIFQHTLSDPLDIARHTVNDIRDLIISKDLPHSVSTRGLYRLWQISWPVEGDATL
ncbi:UNVERIFIED_CONTAM: LINE-1 reverse transcriptase [Sesamum latifolium]|uniref:LINE-1 reverse transcriptase n=1 Tax=Sesamum latifolium TaxID=2727402 RepID=A0AAW2WHT7_9LAMI